MSSFFSQLNVLPKDPIIGLTEMFHADARQGKVNLGVGVYSNEGGKLPLLAAVKQAQECLTEEAMPRGYLPIEGNGAYNKAVQDLLFGAESQILKSGRAVTVQALGGTGALKIGADFLYSLFPDALVAISNPSWENHQALFERAGFRVVGYPYYDPKTHGVDFEGMISSLQAMPARTIVVLHACCHNPTGSDLTQEQWQQVLHVMEERCLIAFLDMAYQGFAEGIEADGIAVRMFAESNVPLFIASSFSKSFSLYGERVGALTVVCSGELESPIVLSHLKRTIRTNYSNPPSTGAEIVRRVLVDTDLRKVWEDELGDMRYRIMLMRETFSRLLKERHDLNFDFVKQQRGMFSYTGLSPEQVQQMREQYGVYAVSTGRVCMAALNLRNMCDVTSAIAAVIKGKPCQ